VPVEHATFILRPCTSAVDLPERQPAAERAAAAEVNFNLSSSLHHGAIAATQQRPSRAQSGLLSPGRLRIRSCVMGDVVPRGGAAHAASATDAVARNRCRAFYRRLTSLRPQSPPRPLPVMNPILDWPRGVDCRNPIPAKDAMRAKRAAHPAPSPVSARVRTGRFHLAVRRMRCPLGTELCASLR
jgi:hypothetical protein